MSVLIRGMEMPTNCGKCKLFDRSHAIGLFAPLGWCRVNGKEIFLLSEKADFCPLAPVPPHGRLIDADALKHSLCVECELYPSKCLKGDCDWDCIWHIDHAPTVIPAEEVET